MTSNTSKQEGERGESKRLSGKDRAILFLLLVVFVVLSALTLYTMAYPDVFGLYALIWGLPTMVIWALIGIVISERIRIYFFGGIR